MDRPPKRGTQPDEHEHEEKQRKRQRGNEPTEPTKQAPAPMPGLAESATKHLKFILPCIVKVDDGSLFGALTSDRQEKQGQLAFVIFDPGDVGASPKLILQLGNQASGIKLQATWGITDYEENEWVLNHLDIARVDEISERRPEEEALRVCPIMWREDLVCMSFRAWPQNLGPEVWNSGTARERLVSELRETVCAMFRTRVQYRLRIWFLANLKDERFERYCLPYFLNAANTRVQPYLLAAQEPEMTAQEEEMDEMLGFLRLLKEQGEGPKTVKRGGPL